jgi:hypothetical protein
MAKSKGGAEGGTTKAEMIREALRELGNVPPKQIQSFIFDRHKVTIPTTMISSYKSNHFRKQGGGGRGTAGSAAIGVKELTILRNLIDRVGPSELQAVIRVLSK